MTTAEGVFQVKLGQLRRGEEPFRSVFWGQLATPSEVLKRLIGERDGGGMAQREREDRLERTLGPFVLGKSTGSELRAP